MNSPFIYDRYVTNRDFIGRKTECNALANLMENNENVTLYAPPKSGKRSLIQQVLFTMRIDGRQFTVSNINLFNIRTWRDFLVKLGNTVVRSVASTPDEYGEIASECLADTRFTFDRRRLADNDEALSLTGEPDARDTRMLFELPGRLSKRTGHRVIVVLEEFQSVLAYDGYETGLKLMEEAFAGLKDMEGVKCSYILTCSKVNAMKFIFEKRRYFHRLTERLTLGPVNEKDVVEHLRRGFMIVGKDLNKEQARGACSLFKGNIWYLNHFCAICNSLSIGYINDGVMMDALNSLISIHEPRLMATMSGLTDNQISFLRAVLDGVVRFSSSEIIAKYSLHSSANVKRVREALFKKEVVTDGDDGDIVFLDPLFEYWVRSRYFEME